MSKERTLICPECKKKHWRSYNPYDGYGNCTNCGGQLILARNSRVEVKMQKARIEVAELNNTAHEVRARQ